MSSDEDKRDLALYRIKQAEESLDEARYLFEGLKSPRSVMNRLYYAMFYSVLSLLIFEPFSSSKHSGVISYFNKRFIKEGNFKIELGRAFNKAFDIRQRSDYKEHSDIDRQQIERFFPLSRKFIDSAIAYLKDNGYI